MFERLTVNNIIPAVLNECFPMLNKNRSKTNLRFHELILNDNAVLQRLDVRVYNEIKNIYITTKFCFISSIHDMLFFYYQNHFRRTINTLANR